jgi:hypothetical protein
MPKSEDFDTVVPPPATPTGQLTPAQKLAAMKSPTDTSSTSGFSAPPTTTGFGAAPATTGFSAPSSNNSFGSSPGVFGSPSSSGFGGSAGSFGAPAGSMAPPQNGMGTMNNASTGNTMAQTGTAASAAVNAGAETLVENDNSDWINKKWRPMMGWVYMGTCTFDFVIAPILWSVLQATSHGTVTSQWMPLTLQGAGLYHVAMGAVLGLTAYGRTKEKIAGAS